MTYFAKVEITKEFESEKDAEEFLSKVLESTKGTADYTKSIRYYKPKTFSSIETMREHPKTFTINIANPTPVNDIATMHKKAKAQLDLMDGGQK